METFIYFVVMLLLSVYMQSKVKIQEPDPINAEDFTLPDNAQDRQLQLIYGTVKSTGFNVIAAGDFDFFEIKKKVDGGMFSGSKKVTVGFGYKIGIVNCFGWGGFRKEVELVDWLVDEDSIYKNTSKGSFSGSVDNKSFFGPYVEGEGGMSGSFSYYSGSENQVVDPYAESMSGGMISPLSNIAYFVWKAGYIGNNGSLKNWQFVLRRIPKPLALNSLYADVNTGANPAYVIFDLLTDDNYGAAVSENRIDTANFNAVGKKLYDEGWGINMNLNEVGKIGDLIAQITNKIDGSLNIDKTTGKFYIKLNRQDYVVDDLPVFDESNIMSISNFSKNTYTGLSNKIKITYTDKNNSYEKAQVVFKDPALTYTMARSETIEMDYSIITDADLAYRIAARDLIPYSTNLFKCEVTVNRFGSGLNIGDVLILSLKKYKIERVVMRIAEIDYGSIAEPEITISLVQDRFGFNYTIFNRAEAPAGSYIDFTALPMDLKVIEAPYFFTNVADTNNKIIGFGQKPNSLHLNFNLTTKGSTDADFMPTEVVDYCPVASLFSGITTQSSTIQTTTGFSLESINNETDDDIHMGDNLSIIIEGDKQEFIAFRTITKNGNGFALNGLRRGLLDTIPLDFSSAAKIYFINYGYSTNKGSFTGTIQARAITRTLRTELVNTTIYSVTANNRKNRPIAPGNLKINNVAFLNTMTVPASNLTFTFNSRDKQNIVQFYDAANTDNKDDVTYRIRIYNNTTSTLVKSVDTKLFSYTFDDETVISGGTRYASLRFELDCITSESIASLYKYSIILNR